MHILRSRSVAALVVSGGLCAAWLAACGGSTAPAGGTGDDGGDGGSTADGTGGTEDGATVEDAGSDRSVTPDSEGADVGPDVTPGGDAGLDVGTTADSATQDAPSDSGEADGAAADALGQDATPDASASDGGGTDGSSEQDAAPEASGAEGGPPDTGADAGSTVEASAGDAAGDAANDGALEANPCGDGVVEAGEECDLGTNNSDLFSTCSTSCKTTALLLHLDASNPSGTGTLPADGTAMGAWVDLAAGRAVVQATSARQPVFRTSAIGGKPAFQFDGISTFFDADLDINASVLPDVTLVVVVQHIAGDTHPYSGVWGADLGGWGRFMSAVGTGGSGVSNGGGFTAVTGLNTAATPLVVTTILAGSTANGSTAYVNGTLGATFTGSTNTNDTRLSIGSLNGPNHFASGYQEYGYIAEVLVYGAALGDTDRQTVETALATKY